MSLRLSKSQLFAVLLPLSTALGGSLYASAQAPGGPVRTQDPTSVLDGVYSEAQAQSGGEVFESTCIRCHNAEQFIPGGLYSPPDRFKNLGEMFTKVSTAMPADDPGSLSPEQYAAAVSIILRIAGYPAGQAELAAETDKLTPIRVVPLPASSGL